jgi:hypothetical protein
VLKGPDLTVPALIKDDSNVDFHSVYSQYLYEYIFRMKNISKGKIKLRIVVINLCIGHKPITSFTFLSESELQIKQAFEQCLTSVDDMAQQVTAYDEVQVFMNLRWYCDAFQKAQNSGDFINDKLSGQSETTNRLSNQLNSYYTNNSEGSTCASTLFKSHIGEMLKVKEVYSNLNLVLTYIYDTVTFHCRLTSEIINEIEDEMQFLQEYDKRWNAFVASMIKMDEVLTPLGRIVNKVYKRVCPDYPCFPHFSFMRLFVIIWKREVYKFCKESIEDDIVKILHQFHKKCLNYSKGEKSVRKQKEKKTSLSDYFSRSSAGKSSDSSGFKSMVSPMLSTIMNPSDSKNSHDDYIMGDQEDESHSVIDLELFYGKDVDDNTLKFDKQGKETVKQIVVDIMDISMHEYSMHYNMHSENEYLTPFSDLKSRIKHEILDFYKKSNQKIPYKLWSEIVSDHTRILQGFLPISILKEVYEYRFYFVKKYTKFRIQRQLKGFNQQQKLKKKQSKDNMRVFSTTSTTHDPTLVTESEYLEIRVQEYINTAFHDLIVSMLKSSKISKDKVLAFMAYIKDHEIDIIHVYNDNYQCNKKFIADMEFKNATIERYKEPRGFPLKLGECESKLYAIEEGVTRPQLEQVKMEKQVEQQQKEILKKAEQEFHNKFDIDIDSYDEAGADVEKQNDFSSLFPVHLTTERIRMSHPVKKQPEQKFEPLNTANLMKSLVQNRDANMDDEESKSSDSDEAPMEIPRLGKLSSFLNSNQSLNKAAVES